MHHEHAHFQALLTETDHRLNDVDGVLQYFLLPSPWSDHNRTLEVADFLGRELDSNLLDLIGTQSHFLTDLDSFSFNMEDNWHFGLILEFQHLFKLMSNAKSRGLIEHIAFGSVLWLRSRVTTGKGDLIPI